MVLTQKQTHRSVEQNREPRNIPMHSLSLYDKGGKNIQWGKKVSSINEAVQFQWGNWTATCKRIKLEHIFSHHIQK